VIEAVRTAAKEWSYAIESVDAAAPTKRTIEVSLKKGN